MTNEQLQSLSTIKELLDSGVLSQEEFDLEKKKILDGSSYIVEDSATIQNGVPPKTNMKANEDKPSVGLNILSFLFGIVGIILYFVTRKQYPIRAKSNLKWSIIGIAAYLLLEIIAYVVDY